MRLSFQRRGGPERAATPEERRASAARSRGAWLARFAMAGKAVTEAPGAQGGA
jgi:hypothetical protein